MELRAKLESWASSRPDDEARAALDLACLFEASDSWAVSRRVKSLTEFASKIATLPSQTSAHAAKILDHILGDLPPKQKRSASKDIHSLRTALTAPRKENLIASSNVLRPSSASDGKPMGKRTKTVNNDLVDEYVRLLESVLKDPIAFLEAYSRLAEDKRVRQPEAAMIARKFYGHAAVSTPRKNALRLIKERHISLQDHRAKTRAQAGKSAA